MAAPLRALGKLRNPCFTRAIYGQFHTGARSLCLQSFSTEKRLFVNNFQVTAISNGIVWNQNRTVATFFAGITQKELWGGVTGTSPAGKKKGRGKGRKKIVDLNRGKIIGVGKDNMLWPGLNAPIVKGQEVLKQRKLDPNPDYEAQLVKLRDQSGKVSHKAAPPLVRGWTGKRLPGQSVGPPDPLADYVFEGFDTKVLEVKIVTQMTGTLGRKHSFTAFVVTGNGNGLAGFGSGKAMTGKAAVRVAKNRAAQQLFYIDRFEDHTVFHNMYNKFHRTKIFVHKREKGYGLKCHRALKTICERIGITDLHCKVEGSTKNVKALTRGFFEMLANQETHEKLAERMGLHVVEKRPERKYLPVAIASPSGATRTEILKDEEEDIEVAFDRLYYGGKTPYQKPARKPFWENYKHHNRVKYRRNKNRNQKDQFLLRRAGLVQVHTGNALPLK